MRTTANFGEQINGWHEEWKGSKELQFQFPSWTDYAFGRRLRAVWEASPDLQRQYGNDFRAFSTATKKYASAAIIAARDKSSRDAAKEGKQIRPVMGLLRDVMAKIRAD